MARMKILVLLFYSLFISSTVWSQDGVETAKMLVAIADEAYNVQKAIDVAKEQYVMAAQADPQNIKANWMAGETYLQTVDREKATEYFLQVYQLDPSYRFDLLYKIGFSYQLGLQFDQALEKYQAYKRKLLNDQNYRGRDKVPLEFVERRIEECENGKFFMANPAHFTIVNVGESINSEWPDYAPVINQDETMMIFTSRRRDGNMNEDVFDDNFPYEDIFISRKVGDSWSPAQNIGEVINTPFFDSNLGLSPDGQQLYIYKDNNGGDIYVCELKGDDYGAPKSLSKRINSSYTEKSITVSADGTKLYFSSDRPGGLGGLDIYMCIIDDDGEWGYAKNMGTTINTQYDEDGPFIDYDNTTLYFSSKGSKGMGGFDIFRTEFDPATEEWSEPVNLGYPINTPDNDIFFVATKDGERGYYASVREDGLGYDDIFMISIPDLDDQFAQSKQLESEPPDLPIIGIESIPLDLRSVKMTVKVVESGSKIPLDARLSIISSQDQTNLNFNRNAKGVFTVQLSPGQGAEYQLRVEKPGYQSKSLNFSVPQGGSDVNEVSRTIRLNRMQVARKSGVRNIYFDFDKIVIKDEAYAELNKLEELLTKNAGLAMEVVGHTDSVGTKQYNLALSQRRAKAVIEYLKSKGLDTSSLTAVGYGAERPLATNDDEREGRELNRRVEFNMLKSE